jgi:hypothetical protein
MLGNSNCITKRYVDDKFAINNMGVFLLHHYHWGSFVLFTLLLIMDRSFGTSFFLSDIYIAGSSIIKVVHLYYLSIYFGFRFGHQEVYIAIACIRNSILLKL